MGQKRTRTGRVDDPPGCDSRPPNWLDAIRSDAESACSAAQGAGRGEPILVGAVVADEERQASGERRGAHQMLDRRPLAQIARLGSRTRRGDPGLFQAGRHVQQPNRPGTGPALGLVLQAPAGNGPANGHALVFDQKPRAGPRQMSGDLGAWCSLRPDPIAADCSRTLSVAPSSTGGTRPRAALRRSAVNGANRASISVIDRPLTSATAPPSVRLSACSRLGRSGGTTTCGRRWRQFEQRPVDIEEQRPVGCWSSSGRGHPVSVIEHDQNQPQRRIVQSCSGFVLVPSAPGARLYPRHGTPSRLSSLSPSSPCWRGRGRVFLFTSGPASARVRTTSEGGGQAMSGNGYAMCRAFGESAWHRHPGAGWRPDGPTVFYELPPRLRRRRRSEASAPTSIGNSPRGNSALGVQSPLGSR